MLPGDNVVPGNNEGVAEVIEMGEEDAAEMVETGQEEGLTELDGGAGITHASEEDETDDVEMEDFEEYGEVRIRTLSFPTISTAKVCVSYY